MERLQIKAEDENLKKAHETGGQIAADIMNEFTPEYQAVVVSCIMKNINSRHNETIIESKHKFEQVTADYTAFLNAIDFPEIDKVLTKE